MTETSFFEDLPDNCPLDGSAPCNGTYYRVVFRNPATSECFWSQRLERGAAHTFSPQLTECQIRGVSVFSSKERCSRILRLNPFKGSNFKGIVSVTLTEDDGVMMQTGNDRSHFTWWRTKLFDYRKARIEE